jgi:ribosomal protein L11 methyltransferase
VTCLEATGFDHPTLTKAAPFDLIFANILKGPLIALAPDISRHVTDTGHVILSGLLNEQAKDVLAVYRDQGFQSIRHQEIGEWTTLTLSKNTTR